MSANFPRIGHLGCRQAVFKLHFALYKPLLASHLLPNASVPPAPFAADSSFLTSMFNPHAMYNFTIQALHFPLTPHLTGHEPPQRLLC